MPSTSESKASRTARASAESDEGCAPLRGAARRVALPVDGCCDCGPPRAAKGFLSVALPLTVLAGGVAFVFVFCASADAESAATSDATKIIFLNIAETPLSKISDDATNVLRISLQRPPASSLRP